MTLRYSTPRTTRIVASLLALVWLGAGLAALVLALGLRRWPYGLAGLGALWYGVFWVRVARLGRPLSWREALAPWRLKSPPDA